MVDFLDLQTEFNRYKNEAEELMERLNIAGRKEKLIEVEQLSEDVSLWNDPDNAAKVMAEISRRKADFAPWRRLEGLLDDTKALLELAIELDDEESKVEIKANVKEIDVLLSKLHTEALFADKYDHANAILEINAGAGGTESCDWASMLSRMYLRWCERMGYSVDIIDSLDGEQAGIKSMTLEIKGNNVYGYLKSERGVHRLVRISPFDSQNRRHTSFCSVDIIPDVDDNTDIEVRDEDIKIDTYRASGAGGQHVNKTESAIRITHLATNIVVTCQNERSQLKNKESAMRVLKARLLERERQAKEAELNKIRGVQSDIAWGSQIRSYVLQPYTMIKDHRTEHETGNVSAVLDGDLDDFMVAYLQMLSKERSEEV